MSFCVILPKPLDVRYVGTDLDECYNMVIKIPLIVTKVIC